MPALASDLGFRHLLLLTLSAAGCSTHQPAQPPDELPATAPQQPLPGAVATDDCDLALLSDGDLKPAQPIDGASLRLRSDQFGQPTRSVIGTDGKLCLDAADDSLCATAATQAWMSDPIRRDCGQVGCVETHLVYSSGDAVGVVDSADALREFLGPIDTAAEARLIAWSQRFDVSCLPSATEGGYRVAATQRMSDCPITIDTVELLVAPDGTLSELGRQAGPPGPCVGRLAPGVCSAPGVSRAIGEWLASSAHMEAVSAHAFEVLVAELRAHDAPQPLIDAAHSAIADEQRHARLMAALAEQYGVAVPDVHTEAVAVRPLIDIAIDNAAEGLGRETWGSLLALWQAHHAQDPHIRAAMAAVAIDEVGHAELSRALHEWLMPLLDASEQQRVMLAKSRAWSALAADAHTPPSDEMVQLAGLPREPDRLLAAAIHHGLA